MMKRVCIAAQVLATAALAACGGDEPASEPVIRPVRSMLVYATGAERLRSFSGTSQAAVQSRLSFKVAGTVERIPVKVGDRVAPGDLIAELDPKDFELRVQEADAALTSARAQLTTAESSYRRVRELWENRNASRNDLESARFAEEAAQAQVQAAESRLEQARLQLSYARLTSPVAGSIAQVTVEANENVSPGMPVALLTSGSRLEVNVDMPEALISQIREGDAAEVRFDAVPDRSFPATVQEVGVSATGAAATYPVTVRLDGEDDTGRPGMAAEVTFRFGGADARERILVPAVAVGEDRQGRFVYTVTPTGEGLAAVSRRSVTVGDLTQGGLEIMAGLADGERVVTAGVTRIRDGQQVRLMGE